LMRHKAVLIGTGALGLGFVVERMAADYDLCLTDVYAKKDLLRQIQVEQGYILNVCDAVGVQSRRVCGAFQVAFVDDPDGPAALDRALLEADLVLTATDRRILDRVVGRIAPALKARTRTSWLLFCENGLGIAADCARAFGPQVVCVDTVMSRMCRFSEPGETGYESFCSGAGTSLIVEEYTYWPLDAERCQAGPFTPVFSLLPPAEFRLWEDVKLYLHNGMHAFVSYHAYLEGATRCPQASARIRREAQRVMLEEVIPAICRTHRVARREWLEEYALALLDRFFNPYFNDTVERGIRRIADKLAPGERLLGGCEYIRRAGLDPVGYASSITAAQQILRRRKEETNAPGHRP